MESKLNEEKDGDSRLGEGGEVNGLNVMMEAQQRSMRTVEQWKGDSRLFISDLGGGVIVGKPGCV